MSSKRIISNSAVAGFLFLLFLCLASTNVVNAAEQIFTHIDEILNANPLPPGEKAQTITVIQDDTITFLVLRMSGGAMVKSHVHKTHSETVYAVKGTGQMLMDGKWVDLKPGSVIFNPMGKVHAAKQTGGEPLVVISIFTPAMKEMDRHFVEK